jgi:hypothetical protein
MAADLFEPVLEFFSGSFGLPAHWFVFPTILTHFLIPLIALIYAWYVLLYKRLRIFRSYGANVGIAIMIGIFSTSILAAVGPALMTSMAVGAAVLLMGRFGFWRIVGCILIMIVISSVYPWLIDFLGSMPTI